MDADGSNVVQLTIGQNQGGVDPDWQARGVTGDGLAASLSDRRADTRAPLRADLRMAFG
jgi:hypothetical protein